MLKLFKGVLEFYGNGSIYITDGKRTKFEKHSFLIQNLKTNRDDIWITSGVVVGLKACCQYDAVEQLKTSFAEETGTECKPVKYIRAGQA
jgi:hypothetical protein